MPRVDGAAHAYGPALTDLLGGHVTVMFASTASARPLVLAGKLRALGISSASAALDWPAQLVATAARARGLAAFGQPGPVAEIADMGAYAKLLERAKAMGFSGTLCIHPKQVAVANRVYSSSPEEIALAREIISAFEASVREGKGAFALHGRMIDAPIVDQARATLSRIR